MFGENDVRRRVAPISSAMEWKALLKIASSIGSVCADIDHHVQKTIHFDATAWRNERGRAVFRHNSRAVKNVTGSQLSPFVHNPGEPISVAVDLLIPEYRLPSLRAFFLVFANCRCLASQYRSQTKGNGFYLSLAVGVTVTALMFSMEALGRVTVPIDGDLVPLPDIAKVHGTEALGQLAIRAFTLTELFEVLEVLRDVGIGRR